MKRVFTFCAQNLKWWVLLSLTLGLAPFVPEPHLWGKIKWVAGGANGMQLMDWFDLFLHGTPWLLLILGLIGKVLPVRKKIKSH